MAELVDAQVSNTCDSDIMRVRFPPSAPHQSIYVDDMKNELACPGLKFELGGPSQDTIGLPVKILDLPSVIALEDSTLILRDTFHVSLVCIGRIIEKNSVSIGDFKSRVINDFCEFSKNNVIELTGYRKEFRFVAQAERKSLVVMCDVSNLNKFFDILNQKYSLNLEYPPTHVTLYTLQKNVGIFLTDSQDINLLTRKTTPPLEIETAIAQNNNSL